MHKTHVLSFLKVFILLFFIPLAFATIGSTPLVHAAFTDGVSDAVVDSTDGGGTAPAAPTLYTPSATQTSVSLSWSSVSGATGYKVYMNGLLTATVSTTSYTKSSLNCSTSYSFYVKAYNSYGTSAASNTQTKSTSSCPPPSAPTLYTPSTTQTSISLSWSSVSGATGYKVYYRLDAQDFMWTQIDTTSSTSYIQSSYINCGLTYQHYIVAYNAYGDSSASNIQTTTTLPCTPSAPSGVSLTAINEQGVLITWSDTSSNESGFKIYRYDENASAYNTEIFPKAHAAAWVYVTSVGQNSESYTASASCGNTYSYGVSSYNSGGSSSIVSGGSVSTPACDTTGPTISFSPTSRSWDNTNAVVTVTATDPSGVSYVRHCWTNSTSLLCDPGTTASNTFTNGGSVTQSSDGSWNLCVRARDSVGNWSSSSCSGTYRVDKTAPTPNPPSVSISAISRTGATVSVSSGSDALVGLSTTPYGISTNGSTYSWSSSTSQTLSGLTCGTNYTVYGKIRDSLGNETSAGTAALTTLACDTTGPTISFSPTSRSWSSSNASVTVTASDESGVASTKYCWTTGTSCTPSTSFTNGTAVTQSSTGNWKLFITATDTLSNTTTNSSQYYQVDKTAPTPNPPSVSTSSTSQTGTTITVASGSDSDSGLSATAYGVSTNGSTYSWSSSTSQSVSGLSCGTSYTAYGKIRDSVGNETSAGTSSFTTVVCTPSAPTGLTASAVSQTQINLSWNASSGATGYKIYRGGVYLTSVTGTTYSNTTGLNCGTTYSYTVRAYNAGGTSGDSVADSATTSNCISAPTVLQNALNFQVKPGTTNYTATWQDASADGYVLYKIDDADGSVEVLGNLTSLSNTGTLPSRCPADYTIGFYAYNLDPTVSSVDSTCQSVQTTSGVLPQTGRKCSEIRTTNVDIRHCTQGFLVD